MTKRDTSHCIPVAKAPCSRLCPTQSGSEPNVSCQSSSTCSAQLPASTEFYRPRRWRRTANPYRTNTKAHRTGITLELTAFPALNRYHVVQHSYHFQVKTNNWLKRILCWYLEFTACFWTRPLNISSAIPTGSENRWTPWIYRWAVSIQEEWSMSDAAE